MERADYQYGALAFGRGQGSHQASGSQRNLRREHVRVRQTQRREAGCHVRGLHGLAQRVD
jgi:hypothetical protein